MDFKTFVQTKALEDRLPFGLSFDISPDFGDCLTEQVAGFAIPRFDELLSREAWFFELLGTANTNRRNDVQFQLRALSADLKERCQLPNLSAALTALFSPSEELQSTPEYEDFIIANSDKLNKLVELSNLLENDTALNWLKVSFFLLSRVDGAWTLGKTTALRKSQIDEITSFISKEMNGGVAPQQTEEASVIDDNAVMEGKRRIASKGETGG